MTELKIITADRIYRDKMNRGCTSCCRRCYDLTGITKICSLPFANDDAATTRTRERERERDQRPWRSSVHSGIIIIEKYNPRDAIVLRVVYICMSSLIYKYSSVIRGQRANDKKAVRTRNHVKGECSVSWVVINF